MSQRLLPLLILPVALAAGTARAGELQDDLKARRAAVMEALGPQALLILWSAEEKVYSHDVDYEFRQDSDLLYLTGIGQPETILVLMPGNKTQRELLFVRPQDPSREHREGHTLTKEEAREQSGIETVYLVSELEPFLASLFNRRPYGARWGDDSGEYDAFFEAIRQRRARMAFVLGTKPRPSDPLPPVFQFAARVRDRYPGVAIEDATDLLSNRRQVKTAYEQKVLRRSGEISSEAHMAGMRAARPGRYEYEVEAAIEKVYLERGAEGWSYPSIVASGPNATILHYSESSRQMEPGDLLLVDAAANYQGLTVDITRAYPVSGRFSDAQREIYELLLAAQEAGMKAAKAGNRASDIEKAVAGVVKSGLLKLGLITDASGDQYRTWYTHGVCHWIGMDVHDVGDYGRPLGPGMTFVIEPGIYVREAALAELPSTLENAAFIGKVRPAVERYKDIGVRVEDSFLLTEKGLERLSAKVPRTVAEIEAYLAQGR